MYRGRNNLVLCKLRTYDLKNRTERLFQSLLLQFQDMDMWSSTCGTNKH